MQDGRQKRNDPSLYYVFPTESYKLEAGMGVKRRRKCPQRFRRLLSSLWAE